MIIKCYDDSQEVIIPDTDTPIFELEVIEPLTPTSSYFQKNGKKYMVTKCYSYQDKDGEEAWMATVQQVEKLGVGYNVSTFNPRSKIWGDEAWRLQRKREELQKRGIDTDILEELGDIMTLNDQQIDELAQMSQAIKPTPPTAEELQVKVNTLEAEKADLRRQVGLIDKLVEKGSLTQAEADDLKNVS